MNGVTMTKRTLSRAIATLAIASQLAACAVTKADVEQAAGDRQAFITKAAHSVTSDIPARPQPITRIAGNYLGGQVLPVSKSLALPAAAREVVFNCGPGAKGSLESVAWVVRRFTGMSVRVDADVTSTLPTAAVRPAGPPRSPLPPELLGAPAAVTVQVSHCGSGGSGEFPLTFAGDLADYLNNVASLSDAHWEFVNNEVHIYRRVTRTFTLMVSPGEFTYKDDTSSSNSANGGGANAQTSSAGTFSGNSNVSTSAQYAPWTALEQSVKTLLTPNGRYTLNQASGTLIVTDTQEAVDRVADWVKAENAGMTRQVAIEIREISVQLRAGNDIGLDANLVFQKLNAATGLADWAFKFNSPTSLTTGDAGTIGYNIAKPDSRLSGSNVVLHALNTLGTVVGDQSRTIVTTNRVPGRLIDVTDRSYLASTTPSTSSLTGAGTPGLQPGLISYGDNLVAVPTVGDNNTVLLQLFLQRSNLLELDTVTAGTGQTFQQITTPVTARRKNGSNFLLNTGETLVIVGNDANSMSNSDAYSVTGGSRTASKNRVMSVMLVTARVLPGV
jgi:type IVB pilus formation R64 PilN family outer membrane protein